MSLQLVEILLIKAKLEVSVSSIPPVLEAQEHVRLGFIRLRTACAVGVL